MKSAAGPLLFLGACRIHLALWANHRESPCGRGAEGTTQGARPSEEAWDRSECRFDTSSLEPLRLVSVSPRLATALSQICPGSVTAPFGVPLVNVAKRRQLSHSRDICPLECYGLPLSLPPLLPLAPPGFRLLHAWTPSPVPWAAGGRLPRRTRSARRLQAGARWVPGRDGYPDGEAAPVLASPGSHRRQAEGAPQPRRQSHRGDESSACGQRHPRRRVDRRARQRAALPPLLRRPLAGYNL